MVQNNLRVRDILSRIKQIESVRLDKDLLEILNVQQARISAWNARNTIPLEILVEYALQRNININWLLTGEGSIYNKDKEQDPYDMPLKQLESDPKIVQLFGYIDRDGIVEEFLPTGDYISMHFPIGKDKKAYALQYLKNVKTEGDSWIMPGMVVIAVGKDRNIEVGEYTPVVLRLKSGEVMVRRISVDDQEITIHDQPPRLEEMKTTIDEVEWWDPIATVRMPK